LVENPQLLQGARLTEYKKGIRIDFKTQTVKPVPATFSSFLFALQGIDSKVRSDLAGD
jgi:hypothetical protein